MKPRPFARSESKVMFAATYLRDAVYDWFEPHLTDFTGNEPSAQKRTTREIFESWQTFEEEIKKVFGSVDEECTAERKIQELRQIGSVNEYAFKF